MSDYIKIAEELEALAADATPSLDKVAAAAMLYGSMGVEGDADVDPAALVKIASSAITEANVALELGVNIGLKAIMDMEV